MVVVPGACLPTYSTLLTSLPLRQYVADAHRAGAKVKLYYTARHSEYVSIPIVSVAEVMPYDLYTVRELFSVARLHLGYYLVWL